MTDQELLEKAAKAAGYRIEKLAFDGEEVWILDGREWNPLEDDGDALRLAVSLGMDISIHDMQQVNCGRWSAEPGAQWDSPIPFGSDACAATRRAIVRTAAAIGDAQ